MKLQPYLNFAGNAEEAFAFYKSVFGGEFSALVRFKDFPMEGLAVPPEDEDKIMHISLPLGEDVIMMASDTLEGFGRQLRQGNNVYLSVHPTSREEADRIFNALSEARNTPDSFATLRLIQLLGLELVGEVVSTSEQLVGATHRLRVEEPKRPAAVGEAALGVLEEPRWYP